MLSCSSRYRRSRRIEEPLASHEASPWPDTRIGVMSWYCSLGSLRTVYACRRVFTCRSARRLLRSCPVQMTPKDFNRCGRWDDSAAIDSTLYESSERYRGSTRRITYHAWVMRRRCKTTIKNRYPCCFMPCLLGSSDSANIYSRDMLIEILSWILVCVLQ